MFTGIVTNTGVVSGLSPVDGGGIQLDITSDLALNLGESIALNGVCSTVSAHTSTGFSVQFLPETLKKTTFSRVTIGESINMELPLTLTTKLGGHWVSGHVDEVGAILSLDTDGPFAELKVHYGSEFSPFLIQKGSVTLDGISLTVVDLSESWFTCHLIEHTKKITSLGFKKTGDSLNIEYDILGKYLYRFYSLRDHE